MDINAIVAAAFGDLDLEAVEQELDRAGVPAEYSVANVALLDAMANRLSAQHGDMKRAEAPRAERKALAEQIGRIIQAKTFLLRLRGTRPGDVGVTVAPVGATEVK